MADFNSSANDVERKLKRRYGGRRSQCRGPVRHSLLCGLWDEVGAWLGVDTEGCGTFRTWPVQADHHWFLHLSVWNGLVSNITQLPSLQQFKKSLKLTLLSSYL